MIGILVAFTVVSFAIFGVADLVIGKEKEKDQAKQEQGENE